MEDTYESKSLAHLGLVAGMIDELAIVKNIDKQLQLAGCGCPDVSIGTICKALIINGLGFSQRTLYMVSSFFEDKPIELLLGSGIKASQLNDTVLGRALDAIHAYGCTELYAHLVPDMCKILGLDGKVAHMDSTDFHVDGVYNSKQSEVDEHLIRLTQGYSRDHRPDLNQVVLNLIVENQAGIVLHMQGLDGNTSDKTAFHDTIKAHIKQLQNVHDLDYIVMDSAGYTQNSLRECGTQIKWISRVPETLTECKTAIAKNDENWSFLAEGYQYIPLSANYAEITQRWLLVFSAEAYKREMITLRDKFAKESTKEYKAFEQLCKSPFACETDAQKAFDKFSLKCKYLTVSSLIINKVAYFDKKGRPKKDEIPAGHHYFITAEVCCSLTTFEKMAHTKGKFILATNELNFDKLPDTMLFKHYKAQSKVERGFRFLKDPQFMASTLFVKKPERIEALLFIMTLCLTVYAAIEFRIRQALLLLNLTLPNQLGKQVKNPTARWIFTAFANITILYLNKQHKILNVKELHRKVIDLLGNEYHKYYFFM
jgi:transposase